MTAKTEDWLTTKGAAQMAGVTDARIRQLCISNQLECRKWGRDWQVNAESLKEWMKKR